MIDTTVDKTGLSINLFIMRISLCLLVSNCQFNNFFISPVPIAIVILCRRHPFGTISFVFADGGTLQGSVRYSASPSRITFPTFSCFLAGSVASPPERERCYIIFKELHNYHFNCSSLLVKFQHHHFYQSLRKARLVLRCPSPPEKSLSRFIGIGIGLYIGLAFNKLSIDIGCGCIIAPSLNLSRPVYTIFSPGFIPPCTK